jgi:hypothetical protein
MRVSRILSGGIRQGNFSNHHIKGIAKIEMNAWETVWYRENIITLRWIPRSVRRFNESWYKWVPVIGACYATSMWADAFTHKEERKNPADFANDE